MIDNVVKGTPLFTYQSEVQSAGPLLSHNGEIAVIATTEKTGTTEYTLEAYNVADGTLIGELWDGEGTGISPAGFASVAGDMRFAGSTNKSGYFINGVLDRISKDFIASKTIVKSGRGLL